ncbi:MAG: prepilin-type N-terminal cleavage/methylation domain-containing protein [Desulfobacula sp.]|nr:prepilin-type N-terminal cleavage/methylation domain-containing protein [Desulfobacula sp.]
MTASNYILSARKDNGFTLLEVMISVSIIALILTSLFRMQSGTIGLATADKFNSIAPALAQQLLVRMEHDLANWSEVEGDFGETFPGIKWACEISDSLFEEIDFISEENYNNFKRIDVEITDSSRQRSYKFTTWRFVIE